MTIKEFKTPFEIKLSGENIAAWGLMLAGLVRHIANAYQQEEKLNFHKTVTRFKSGFDAELESPTDFPKVKLRVTNCAAFQKTHLESSKDS